MTRRRVTIELALIGAAPGLAVHGYAITGNAAALVLTDLGGAFTSLVTQALE